MDRWEFQNGQTPINSVSIPRIGISILDVDGSAAKVSPTSCKSSRATRPVGEYLLELVDTTDCRPSRNKVRDGVWM